MRAPGTWTLELLFAGRPGSLALFHTVREYLESIGPVKMAVLKTMVSFGAKTNFAWVWLPQTGIKKRPENSIALTFDLNREIRDDRIAETVELSPGRFTHHVIIETESDLDPDIRKWLRESYDAHSGKDQKHGSGAKGAGRSPGRTSRGKRPEGSARSGVK